MKLTGLIALGALFVLVAAAPAAGKSLFTSASGVTFGIVFDPGFGDVVAIEPAR